MAFRYSQPEGAAGAILYLPRLAGWSGPEDQQEPGFMSLIYSPCII